ncbi:hypothetical protein MJO29_001118, partial [Puccinia striiformis f. sp. tritici]
CTNSGLKSYQCRTGSCGNGKSITCLFTFSRCVKYTDAGGVGVGEVPSVRFQSFMDHPESGYLGEGTNALGIMETATTCAGHSVPTVTLSQINHASNSEM